MKTKGKALIIDLNKDEPKTKLDQYVDRMNLTMFDSYFTKLTFKSLAKSAYTKNEIQDIIKKSKFKQCKIIDEEIGFEIWLEKLGTPISPLTNLL